MKKQRQLVHGGKLIRVATFDGCSLDRLVKTGHAELIARRLKTRGVHVQLLHDVIFEMLAIRSRSQRCALLQPLRGIRSHVVGLPTFVELLALYGDSQAPPVLPERVHAIGHWLLDDPGRIEHLRQDLRTDGAQAKRSLLRLHARSRRHYQERVAHGEPPPPFESAVQAALKDRSSMRALRQTLARCAEDRGRSVPARAFRFRHPVLRDWLLGWCYLMWKGSTGSKRQREKLPGLVDLALVAQLSLSDALVTDDEGLRTAAVTVRDFVGVASPWICRFDEIRAALLR